MFTVWFPLHYVYKCLQVHIYISMYVKRERKRKHRPQSRNRGQLNRCYLTAAVCPAWCMGRRYDRDFAYTVWAKTSVPVMTITLWSDKKKSLGWDVEWLVMLFHNVDTIHSHQQAWISRNETDQVLKLFM